MTNRFFYLLTGLVALAVGAYLLPLLLPAVIVGTLLLAGVTLVDAWVLWQGGALHVERTVADRLSNGDLNPVALALESTYPFETQVEVIDEIPAQLQVRDLSLDVHLPAHETKRLRYEVRPTTRGVYGFGQTRAYARTRLGLAERGFAGSNAVDVAVYPSYMQVQAYALYGVADPFAETGIKRVRRLGHTMEFDQIRPYTVGDDVRTVNWKATARRQALMVNQYEDERAQRVYCVIDKGRLMKLPFDGLTLLDHAINASLVLSHIVVRRHDRAGLLTFAETPSRFIPADHRTGQLVRLQQALYDVETGFLESDFEALFAHVRARIKRRSLLMLFTNVETMAGLRRRLPVLRRLARYHLVCVVFFENPDVTGLAEEKPATVEAAYTQAVAQRFGQEKREIVRELTRHGILSVLTPPEELTVNTLNKYIEVKARRML
ncbi:MAG: DUF58 domain-containing protein [Bacteroidota bacterium]